MMVKLTVSRSKLKAKTPRERRHAGGQGHNEGECENGISNDVSNHMIPVS
jgi:hypothetical protein